MSLLNIIKLSPNDTKSASIAPPTTTPPTTTSLPILTTFPLSSLKNQSSIPQLPQQDAFVKAELLTSNQAKPEPAANGSGEKSKTNYVTVTVNNATKDFTQTVDVFINNVVCSYSTKCHLNLRRIATQGMHVEFKKECGMVNMKLRKPYTTATIWPSGKITCAGAKSEPEAYKAARRYCRLLQKMQFKVKLSNYRVVNVLATCTMPFYLDIIRLADEYKKECSYEPELHPGATFKLKELKSTLKLFTTGSITLTSPSVEYAQRAIVFMYPILYQFKQPNGPSGMTLQQSSNNQLNSTTVQSIVNQTGNANSNTQQFNTVYNQIISNGKSDYSIVNLTEKALINRVESSPAILQAQNSFHSQSHVNQTPNQHNHLNHLYNHPNCSTESNFVDNSNLYPQESNINRSNSSYINNFNYLNHHHQMSHDDTNSYLHHASTTPSNASTSHWFNSYDNLLIDHHVDDLLP